MASIMCAKKTYNPKSAFNDSNMPKKGNALSADKEEELEMKAISFMAESLNALRVKEPDLFKNDASTLVKK